ncbi:MAG TPA: type II toxin-antitoxin system RelE/ParE family toxin [Kofleriaceae bacterium]|nr:type II toxin-antitoxin system RelE/ParE family toxin [Kofleriaceae bacterium]
MTRRVVIDDEASEEADEQVRYYAERAGTHVALRFIAEIEAVYRALAEGSVVGVSYPRVQFRLPLKRVFLDRFPFAVVFYVEEDDVHVVAVEALRKRPGYWRARLR